MQAYAALPDGDAPRRLVGFARVEVASGASTPVAIRVGPGALATRDVHAHAMVTRPGRYTLSVARYATDPASRTMDPSTGSRYR